MGMCSKCAGGGCTLDVQTGSSTFINHWPASSFTLEKKEKTNIRFSFIIIMHIIKLIICMIITNFVKKSYQDLVISLLVRS